MTEYFWQYSVCKTFAQVVFCISRIVFVLHIQQLFDLLLTVDSLYHLSFCSVCVFLLSRCEQWFLSVWGPERDDLLWGSNADLSEWVSPSLPHRTFPWASAAQYGLPSAEGPLFTTGTVHCNQTCAHFYRHNRLAWRLDGIPQFLS